MKHTKLMLLAAAAAVAVTRLPPSAAAQEPQPSLQQQFDAAAEALVAGNAAEALRLYDALDARVANSGRNRAIVRVRRAEALLRLGRHVEAGAALRESLPQLPADDASLNDDRARGHIILGRLAELELEYRAALPHYEAAAAIPAMTVTRLEAYRGMIQTQMFHDAAAALVRADEAIALAEAAQPRDRALEGEFRSLRGRVLLNMGRSREARNELVRATERLGGLGTRVDLRDLVARSDLSLAAALTGDQVEARRYLALTGAGRARNSTLPLGSMTPPPCSDTLRPDVAAVVELHILRNGTIGSATPVYASTQGDDAVAFARAALAWTWDAQEIAPLEPLFRSAVRIEMRCSKRVDAAALMAAPEAEEVARWAASLGIDAQLAGAIEGGIAHRRSRLVTAEAAHGASSAHLLGPLVQLAAADTLPAEERAALLRRAIAIAADARAPGAYLVMLGRALASTRPQPAAGEDAALDYLALLDVPGLAGNSYASAAFLLQEADRHLAGHRFDEAAALLARVNALPGFDSAHPLRPAWLSRLVAVEAALGNREAAQAAFAALPAGPWRCSVPVRIRRSRASSADFPNHALLWGFEGWTAFESTVAADGGPTDTRVVIAYPPLVFNGAAEQLAGRFRYEPPLVGEEGACAVTNRRIRFQISGR